MKKQWLSPFLAGFLTATLALGLLVALTDTRAAQAQLPEMPYEQVLIFKDMARSLEGIEQALESRCP